MKWRVLPQIFSEEELPILALLSNNRIAYTETYMHRCISLVAYLESCFKNFQIQPWDQEGLHFEAFKLNTLNINLSLEYWHKFRIYLS